MHNLQVSTRASTRGPCASPVPTSAKGALAPAGGGGLVHLTASIPALHGMEQGFDLGSLSSDDNNDDQPQVPEELFRPSKCCNSRCTTAAPTFVEGAFLHAAQQNDVSSSRS